jgi:phosphatidylethanolamine-binding protein (PEBP) family uncharacterized protein
VDTHSGALVVDDPDAPGGERHVLAGEIVHVRLAEPIGAAEPQASAVGGMV